MGSVRIAYAAGGVQFASQLTADYWRAIAQYDDGLTHNVIPRLEAMKKLVKDLPANSTNYLYFSMGGMQITQAQLVDYLDEQIKTARKLIKTVNEALGDPPPGPAKPVPVKGVGMIGDAKTFQIALDGSVVKPGNVISLVC